MTTPSISSPLSSISSPLSSVASRSPSPPGDYPSPPSSHESEKGTKAKSRKALHSSDRDDSSPPPKRQRIMKVKELKTEYLDIASLIESDNGDVHKNQETKMRKLLDVLRTKRRIVVIAGAGISVSAGSTLPPSSIPTTITNRRQYPISALLRASSQLSDPSTSSRPRESIYSTQLSIAMISLQVRSTTWFENWDTRRRMRSLLHSTICSQLSQRKAA